MTTHALVTPWPISQGLRTWCGYSGEHPVIASDSIATQPEAVDCETCKAAMRKALGTLSALVPRLK